MGPISLFGKKVKLREYKCSLNGGAPVPVSEPYTNLYVRINNGCNANCDFCEFAGSEEVFDFDKFEEILKELKSKLRINKISFTGGEPTIDMCKLNYAIALSKGVAPNSFIVVNTNGVNLQHFRHEECLVDSIALSRHHYEDEVNNRILGFEAPSSSDIKQFQDGLRNKERLHLSCNLIKGYIDSVEEAEKYLTHCSRVGVRDVGFVSLMKVNQYCHDNFISLEELNWQDYERFFQYTDFKDIGAGTEPTCKCGNYCFIPPKSQNLVLFYARHYCKHKESIGQLVFDGVNLKTGFTGEVIA